ncbi:hypothetical protein BCR32DRAFT_297968 [Anaeromyces robustus]|uniref:AAA-ATPase-like domain-containing protein n=1 Tax=Anaeromyces robustus TaxID=1754192 RepID=A0A1Y1VU57_9FUNG|nr:hypothetical protein BCR32DRAFT_297968 [Anaeromyces robustus]|eukprot:ORX64713.1 hypothetical protein BCR32DRAFT_297968 [Anaeromyces robustus]
MGEYIDSCIAYNFELLYNSIYFVDKSNIIRELNKLLQTPKNCICITKPRRFGKTSIAALVIAYYSKSRKDKFKKIFDKLNISKHENADHLEENFEVSKISGNEIIHFRRENLTYEETQGKYYTIYIDFSENIKRYEDNGLKTYLLSIEKKIINELKSISTDFKNIIDEYSKNGSYFLNEYIKYLYIKTGEKFIFVIDEWDYMFNHKLFTVNERNYYLTYLKDLLKNKPYVAFAYMTGILPTAKGNSKSDLNFFNEFSMLEDDKYYKYFGFTEKEVKDLCKKKINSLKYKDIEEWYDGYISNNGEKIFNSWSIISAFENNKIRNYWKETGPIREVKKYINFNIHGVKDDFLRLVAGDKIKIKLRGYSAENKQSESENNNNNNNNNNRTEEVMKNEMYSSMVVYGFLTYNSKKNEIYIPNKELFEKFIIVLEETKDTQIYNNLKEISQEILDATLNKNNKEICNLLKKIPMEEVPKKFYYNPITLGFIVKYAYFDAKIKYNIEQEKEVGEDVVDFIFYPKDILNGIVIILELKIGKSAKDAIKQIYERQYYNGLREKGYKGKVLLVGININKKSKKYTYIIEEYNEIKNNKKRNNNINSDNNNIMIKRRKRKQN